MWVQALVVACVWSGVEEALLLFTLPTSSRPSHPSHFPPWCVMGLWSSPGPEFWLRGGSGCGCQKLSPSERTAVDKPTSACPFWGRQEHTVLWTHTNQCTSDPCTLTHACLHILIHNFCMYSLTHLLMYPAVYHIVAIIMHCIYILYYNVACHIAYK